MEDNKLITTKQLEQQIWEIEHVKVCIDSYNKNNTRLVRPYNFEPLTDGNTVDDLKERINYCLSPFIYYIHL